MFTTSLAVLLSVTTPFGQAGEPLQVMRATPRGSVEWVDEIKITFDRPVAAGLAETIDPGSIVSIEPAVEGVLEWRDPVTIRFVPARPLARATEYRVTVADNFEAMDGSRLAEPFVFSFRVSGPRVLAGLPVGEQNQPPRDPARFIRPQEEFELLLTARPSDTLTARLASIAHLTFDRSCDGPTRIDLRPSDTRAIDRRDDPWYFTRHAEYGPYSERADQLTVVKLTPAALLPKDCRGTLVIPSVLDPASDELYRWQFKTYGPFSLSAAHCGGRRFCPTGPLTLSFTTPVRGSELIRHLKVEPHVSYMLHDTTAELATWTLQAELRPRTGYAVVVDTALTDVFGQHFHGDRVKGMSTTGYASTVSYPGGLWLVERQGPRSLKVEHINVDTIEAIVAPVPRSYEPQFLRRGWWNWSELWDSIAAGAARRAIPVTGGTDVGYVTGVRMPVYDSSQPDNPTLLAVRFDSPQLDTTSGAGWRSGMPLAVVQVTDLAIHARLGTETAAAWVTGVEDGLPKPGVLVTLFDGQGRPRANGRTDARGLVELGGFHGGRPDRYDQLEGYFAASEGDDRALVGIGGYDPYLSPWRFNVRAAWGDQRKPLAAAVFTERDIYRPGEPVYAKAIVRRGPLGGLEPAVGDSLRWRFNDRENGILRDTTVQLSSFGTSDARLELPTELPLGWYRVRIDLKDGGDWSTIASTSYRVAEYRPPEFLVDVVADTGARFAGDSVSVDVEARYLFGAAMGRAAVAWTAREQPLSVWALRIPDTEGYYLGTTGRWWEEPAYDTSVRTIAGAQDTLDDAGHLDLSIVVPEPRGGSPARATIEASVTDINRQSSAASASVTVHPAAFYIGAKPAGERYFWRDGEEQEIDLIAVRPAGGRVAGVSIDGSVVRREWHRVRRERRGRIEYVGEWVSDTVATCAAVTATEPVPCRFTTRGGGSYFVNFAATDDTGRAAVTGFYRWVVGEDWVPWYDENQLNMDVIADKSRYDVGDTATVFIASPFTDVDAWVTVERETIIEQRLIHITSGSTTLRFPITEAHAPNAFVSVLVARGRSAPPGPPDDPGRPTIRVGYAELRVEPEVKRLTVNLKPLQDEYRPGDTARVELHVTDSDGAGRRSEVTLWAVDEGVLALTGYKTPDPIDLIYRPRGLGMALTSNLVAVAEQVAEEMRAKGEPPGGGGMEESGVLRSRFLSTPFFLGSVVTDADGRAVASAKLPDNLTTFRVMAVAVTEGDRYGSGDSELLVTRPLLARPALPRFLREGDEFAAGVVVNHRLGGTPTVRVDTEVENVRLVGDSTLSVTLEPGRGTEARFRYRATAGADSATFRFMVSGGAEVDAVQRSIAIRPSYHPRAHTAAGILWDRTEHATIVLPGDIDPERSTLEISVGGTPLAFVQGVRRRLQVYPYYCSEQVASTALPIIALYRAQQTLDRSLLEDDPRTQIEQAVAMLSRRQRVDGAIGFWTSDDWTSPWLSAYAGQVLLEARAADVAVNDTVLDRIAVFLEASLRGEQQIRSPLVGWYRASSSLYLADQVAAVDFLSQLGRPATPAENRLLNRVAQMRWEDRVRLAEVVARHDLETARRLLEPAWAAVQVEGRRASIPDTIIDDRHFYFRSSARSAARLFTATLAVDPSHTLVSPLLATLVSRGRIEERRYWTTQDYGAVVLALLRYEDIRSELADRTARVASADRLLAESPAGALAPSEAAVPLTGLLTDREDGDKALRVSLAASETGRPIYYYFTVREVPLEPPVRPADAGIQVERWYELYDQPGQPIIEAAAGELVRVRLRISVPNERHFFVLDDPLPAGLEAVDISLRTEGQLEGADLYEREAEPRDPWWYGAWYYGYWSPFDHRELRDDRVVYAATVLWAGTYEVSYVARATTSGTFARPPAHAEEMYNPALNGRSDGGSFAVDANGR